jgi:hypothetical protein
MDKTKSLCPHLGEHYTPEDSGTGERGIGRDAKQSWAVRILSQCLAFAFWMSRVKLWEGADHGNIV